MVWQLKKMDTLGIQNVTVTNPDTCRHTNKALYTLMNSSENIIDIHISQNILETPVVYKTS